MNVVQQKDIFPLYTHLYPSPVYISGRRYLNVTPDLFLLINCIIEIATGSVNHRTVWLLYPTNAELPNDISSSAFSAPYCLNPPPLPPLYTLVQKSNNKLEENIAHATFMRVSIPLEGKKLGTFKTIHRLFCFTL